MIELRRSAERGHADHGWLDSRHTFSFADYHDPRHLGFRALRVINDSSLEPVHFLQMWVLPERQGLPPSYEEKTFPPEERRGRLRLLASRDGRDGSVTIHQDTGLYGALLDPGREVSHTLGPGRHAWIQVARGAVVLNGQTLRAGEGAALSDEPIIRIGAREAAEVLVFDLP